MIDVKFDTKEFHEFLKKFPAQAKEAGAHALNEIATRQRDIVARRAPGGAAGVIGKSVQSSKASVDKLRVVIGSAHPGAKVLHHGSGYLPGGVIKAGSQNPDAARRRAFPGRVPKYLAIPLPGNRGMTPRDFVRAGTRLFVLTSKKGNKFLAQTGEKYKSKGVSKFRFSVPGKKKAGSSMEPLKLLFLLRESVRIPKHPYMEWRSGEVEAANRTLKKRVNDAAKGLSN